MKLQRVLEKMIEDGYNGLGYRKAWKDVPEKKHQVISLGVSGTFYVYENGLVRPFTPDVYDVMARDWVYEL